MIDKPIVIDAGPMGGGITGTGRYSFRMLNELLSLESELPFQVILPHEDKHEWETGWWKHQNKAELRYADITGVGINRHYYYLRDSIDYTIHHSLSSYVPVFLNARGTRLVTVHDLKHIKIPGLFDGFSRLKRTYVSKMIERSVRVADHVITVSEHTKSDIVGEFGVSPSNVSVVPLGPGEIQPGIEGEPLVSPPYFLFVGLILRHKNVHTLIEAYNEFRENTDAEIDLVIAGSPSEEYLSELQDLISPQFAAEVHFPGYVDDDILARLYKHATALVYPSLYEGFGIPPLEAMGYGTPVIASTRASIPEVVGEAGEYFDATDYIELAKKLESVSLNHELREDLINKGKKRFGKFTWERTAKETLEIYREHL